MKYLRHASVDFAAQALARLTRWLTLTLSMMATSASLHAGPVNVSTGWNLLGNSQSLQVNVADVFGTSNVTTVWKWDNATATWQLYAPSLSASSLSAYAASNGYGVLTVINPGEGVWVNAASSFTAVLPDGAPVAPYSFSAGQSNALQDGWNLVSTGAAITPSSFNSNLSSTPPVAGTIANNFTALWAWDSAITSWYFYAPSLESQGQTVSSNYIASKGYRDFATSGKTLGTGIGFWVALGQAIDAQPPAPGASATTTTTAAPTTTTTTVASTTSTTLPSGTATCQVNIGSAVGYVTGVPSTSYCIGSQLNADGGGATVSPASINGVPPAPGITQLAWSMLSACDPLGAPPSAGAATLTPCRMMGVTTITTTTTTTQSSANATTTTTALPTTTTTTLPSGNATCQVNVGSAIGYVTGVPSSSYCLASLINISGGGASVTLASLPMLTGKTQLAYSALAACDPLGAPPAAGAITLTPCAKNGTPPSTSGTQSISFGSVPNIVVQGTGLLNATGGASGNPVVYTSTTPSVCSVSGNTVTGILAGTCTIAANQAGNANYTAAPQVTQTIVVSAGAQNVSFGLAPALSVGSTGAVSATGGASGNAVTFTSTTPTICTVGGTNGTTVTALAAGNCTIAADQAGNANYTAAPQATQNIAVEKGQQTISFGPTPIVAVDSTGSLSATGGASGNSVVFTSQTPVVCTVLGNAVKGVTAGNCTITANQAGNANYAAAAQATLDLSVAPGTQRITFGVAPVLVAYNTGTVSASGGASHNALVFTSTTPGNCTVEGETLTALKAGTCTVAANQAGNANYQAAAQATQDIFVSNAVLQLLKGWNLVGNATALPIVLADMFSDPTLITSVWKWDAVTRAWQFYSPKLTAVELKAYADAKGYGVLTDLNPGEGFWIDAKDKSTLAVFAGAQYSLRTDQLVNGWNLVATTGDITPSSFNQSLGSAPPVVGVVPINLTSLWAWDNLQAKWYFYSPKLDGQGGSALGDYISAKGYLNFSASGKTLSGGIGFWVDKPTNPK